MAESADIGLAGTSMNPSALRPANNPIVDSSSRPDDEARRRQGRIAYAAQVATLPLYILALWLEVYLDTRKASVRTDSSLFYESHRRWRIRTSFIFLIWTILSGLAIPFGGIGWPVLILTYVWYAVRVMIGVICWQRGRPIGIRRHGNAVRRGNDRRAATSSYITREY